jgi:hypothetical protein
MQSTDQPQGAPTPEKGLNTRQYLVAVLGFLFLSLMAIAVWSHYSARMGKPALRTEAPAGGGATTLRRGK